MAGMAGFEPTNARVKVWCLTAWRHPNILTGHTWYYIIRFSEMQSFFCVRRDDRVYYKFVDTTWKQYCRERPICRSEALWTGEFPKIRTQSQRNGTQAVPYSWVYAGVYKRRSVVPTSSRLCVNRSVRLILPMQNLRVPGRCGHRPLWRIMQRSSGQQSPPSHEEPLQRCGSAVSSACSARSQKTVTLVLPPGVQV